MLSLSEVRLFDADGALIPIVEAYNPGGIAANPFEEPQFVVDGDITTKWLDISFYNETILQLLLASAAPVARYELFTSTGASRANLKRDPTGWRFGISRCVQACTATRPICGVGCPGI